MSGLSNKAETTKIKTVAGQIGYLPGMGCIELTAAHLKRLGDRKKIRLICTVNGKVTFPCGILSRSEGRGFIMFSKKNMKAAGCIPGDTITVELTPDTSRYGMTMSEELQEVLEQDPEGKRRFDMLTPGKQRNIIHYVNSVKASHLRIERSLRLIRNLIDCPEGKETGRRIFGLAD